ncbi:MAG: PKD domain-containing protein [Bacteroidota bacterium]
MHRLCSALTLFFACFVFQQLHGQAPQADFHFSVQNLQVTFSESSSNATGYNWNFGDGNTSTLQNPMHTYSGNGIYQVCLYAQGPGGTDTLCRYVGVTDANSVGFYARSHNFHGDEDIFGTALAADSSTTFFVGRMGSTNGPEDFLVGAVDPMANLLWVNRYDSDYHEFFRTVAATSDGGFVAGGEVSSGGQFSLTRMFLAKFDAAGNMTWAKSYSAPTNVNHSVYSVQVVSDGYVFAGRPQGLVKVDTLGNVQWAYRYGSGFTFDMIMDDRDHFILTGTNTLRINPTGDTVRWGIDLPNGLAPTSVIQTPTRDYLLSGQGFNLDGFFVQIDTMGFWWATHNFQELSFSACLDVLESPDLVRAGNQIYIEAEMAVGIQCTVNFNWWQHPVIQPLNHQGSTYLMNGLMDAFDVGGNANNRSMIAHDPLSLMGGGTFYLGNAPLDAQLYFQKFPRSLGYDSCSVNMTMASSPIINFPPQIFPTPISYTSTVTNVSLSSVPVVRLPDNYASCISFCGPIDSSFSFTVNGNLVQFQSTTGGLWNFGDGNSGSGTQVTHTYQNPGNYVITLMAENQCSTRTIIDTVDIPVGCTPPSAGFDAMQNQLQFSFSDTSTVTGSTQYLWNFGDGNMSNLQNPNHTYANPGGYLVCLTITDSCGTDSICQNILATCPLPTAAFSHTGLFPTLQFSDQSSSATAWFWDFGDGNSASTQNPSHTYATPGTYTVCLTVTDSCGSDTTCLPVDVLLHTTSPTTPQFTLFPNPTSATFILDPGQTFLQPAKVELLDLRGKVLLRWEITEKTELDPVDISDGLYFIRVQHQGRNTTEMLRLIR